MQPAFDVFLIRDLDFNCGSPRSDGQVGDKDSGYGDAREAFRIATMISADTPYMGVTYNPFKVDPSTGKAGKWYLKDLRLSNPSYTKTHDGFISFVRGRAWSTSSAK